MAYQDIMSKLNDQDLPSPRKSPPIEDDNAQKNQLIGDESELKDKDEDQTPTSDRSSGRWGGMISGLGLGILGTIAVMHFYINPKTQTPDPTNPENPVVEVSNSPASGQTVTVAPVELATVTRQLDVTGTVEAYDLLPILPQASGLQIQRVLADEGDLVEAGEVLAVLDNSILRSQIDQAEAGLAKAQANLSKLQTGSRPEQIAAAQAKLDRALANLAQLEAGTRLEEIAVAQAKLNEAEARLADARSGSLQDEIAQARARLEANKADLQLASERVNRYQKLKDQGAVSEDSLEEYL